MGQCWEIDGTFDSYIHRAVGFADSPDVLTTLPVYYITMPKGCSGIRNFPPHIDPRQVSLASVSIDLIFTTMPSKPRQGVSEKKRPGLPRILEFLVIIYHF